MKWTSHGIPLELVEENEALEPSRHHWQKSTMTLKNKSSRSPAMDVQIMPWQLGEAKDTSVYPQSPFLRDTKQSFRHQIDHTENGKVDGNKDHAQKEKTRRKRKQIKPFFKIFLTQTRLVQTAVRLHGDPLPRG